MLNVVGARALRIHAKKQEEGNGTYRYCTHRNECEQERRAEDHHGWAEKPAYNMNRLKMEVHKFSTKSLGFARNRKQNENENE